MIDGLVAGRLYGDAEMREGKNASTYAVAKVKATTGDADPVLVNVIAFAPQACAALMALQDGDPVSLVGSITPKVWTDKQGNTKPALDMVVTKVMGIDVSSQRHEGSST